MYNKGLHDEDKCYLETETILVSRSVTLNLETLKPVDLK